MFSKWAIRFAHSRLRGSSGLGSPLSSDSAHGQSPLWNASDTPPALPPASPSLPLHRRQCISSLSFTGTPSTCFPEVERVRAGIWLMAQVPGWDLYFPLGTSSCIRFWVQVLKRGGGRQKLYVSL